MTDTCSGCRFWKVRQDTENQIGDCHRFPPGAIFGGSTLRIVYPQTAHDEWCGEYKDPDFEEVPDFEEPSNSMFEDVLGSVSDFNAILIKHGLDPLTGLSFSPRAWSILLQDRDIVTSIIGVGNERSICGVPVNVQKGSERA